MVRLEPDGYTASLRQNVRRWRSALASQATTLPAGSLYVGRSIKEARVVSNLLRADLYVVSAGLGLVAADSAVPAYDLSVTGANSRLTGMLAHCGASVTDWWRELTAGHGVRWLLSCSPNMLVLVALPADYLRLVQAEFENLSPVHASRLRVFTSLAGRRVLAHLPNLPVMPYDERLESLPGFAGTRSDFPQRALRHFVSQLAAQSLRPETAHRKVEMAMSSCTMREAVARRRVTDAEVCDLIRKGWDACGGNSARLLRYLRDNEKVACEQGRFAELRRRVGVEMSNKVRLVGKGSLDVR